MKENFYHDNDHCAACADRLSFISIWDEADGNRASSLGGARLELWLERFTRTPVRGLATGTVLTAALQSSTAITVISIGLVNAGILTFPRTLGVILGTNIGTCLTTELIGLSIGGIGVPLLLASASIWLASWFAGPLPPALQGLGLEQTGVPAGQRRLPWLRSVRYGSLAAAGFSLVLLGIEIMQTIGPALQSRGLFAWFVHQRKRACCGALSLALRSPRWSTAAQPSLRWR
ncbi:Na/Pi symporter [Paenibacillus sp. N3.4]|uniref:Na/Pi symporter n=1 Tax=Paenibacillus sp. N3.4 TaxID=2603222 RepID=UPI0028FCF0E1|nr:Na/Pi symporter [Paenibacillus sp. N3.4]